MGKFRVFGTFSALLIIGSIVSIAVRGFNFGLDFAGGYEIQVKLPKAVNEDEINSVISPLGITDARVQQLGNQDGLEYLILVRQQGTLGEKEKDALKNEFETLAGGINKIANWTIAESGEVISVGFDQPIIEDQVQALLSKHNLKVLKITAGERADKSEYTIELASIGQQITEVLNKKMNVDAGNVSIEFVGPQVGEQLRNQGIMAVAISLLFLMLYIAIRFDFYFSPGAIIAILHDVTIVLGVFSFFQIDFTLSTVAGILTLIGYSLNDTVVVYDRIRENIARLRGRELRFLVSSSISETLSRTMLTGLTTMFVVISLFIWGGRALMDFSACLLVGIIIGTYSSIAIAAPSYVLLREQYDRRVKTKASA
ncbi:MAG: protein translocase subunit SecF [Deltaproteobacteria bacterium]|nr:protein translocase subunit SecF [Deltaproteobacteria bacterium]